MPRWPRRDGAAGGVASSADPSQRAEGGRGDGHQRQDDHDLPAARACWSAAGDQCGLLGTVKSVIAGRERAVERTTPEAIDLQADLRAMLDGGDRACAMEVSSHALELGRADAIEFAAAVFTNLTQDHLDFHATMEDYFRAKRRLFWSSARSAGHRPGAASSTSATPTAGAWPPSSRTCSRSRGRGRRLPRDGLRCDSTGVGFTLHAPGGEHEVALPLPGRFNVANALGALAAVHALGVELERAGGGARARRARPRPPRAGGRGPGLRGARRLRPHARLARERAACGARAGRAGARERRDACCACSAPAATATAPSGR